MPYIKDHPVLPELLAWVDVRAPKPSDKGRASAEQAARRVSTICHALDVPPGDIRMEHVGLYARHVIMTKGKPLSPTTVTHLQTSVAAWTRWLDHGHWDPQEGPGDRTFTDAALNRYVLLAPGKSKVSPKTAQTYAAKAWAFCQHAHRSTVVDLTEEDVLLYLAARRARREARGDGRTLSNGTVNNYLSAVRSVCKVLGIPDITAGLERKAYDPEHTPPIKREDLQHLLHTAHELKRSFDPETADMNRRMWMLTKIMSAVGGQRLFAAAKVRPLDDIYQDDQGKWRLRIRHAKGRGARREIRPPYVPQSVVEVIHMEWGRGEQIVPQARSSSQLSRKWIGWASSLGVLDVHPHMLRSYFGRNIYVKTKDIYLVNQALDHASLNTTKGYIGDVITEEHMTVLATFDEDIAPVDRGNILPFQRTGTVAEPAPF